MNSQNYNEEAFIRDMNHMEKMQKQRRDKEAEKAKIENIKAAYKGALKGGWYDKR